MRENLYLYFDKNGKPVLSPHTVTYTNNERTRNRQMIRVRCFISYYYKFYVGVMGKVNRLGHWCPYCNADKLIRQAGTTGILWMNIKIITVFNLRSSDSNVNKEIVKSMLIKSTKTNRFLFAVFHQLLGTGNGAQKKLYHIVSSGHRYLFLEVDEKLQR